MQFKIFVAVMASVILLTGCKPDADKAIALGKQEISYTMHDPESAQFRELKFRDIKEKEGAVSGIVCGEVNAKNLMGAYVGYKHFFVVLEMTPKGMFSSGVTYKVITQKIADTDWREDIYKAYCVADLEKQ